MDSSSLLQLHPQRVNTSNEDLKLSVGQGIDFLECDRSTRPSNVMMINLATNHRASLISQRKSTNSSCRFLCRTLSVTRHAFIADNDRLTETMPFSPQPIVCIQLIDPQDGQFTPYFERSPVSTPDQEFDEPMFFSGGHRSRDSSPDSVLSPLRSRATSIALKKLMETQAQMLLDISAAWKKKYPVDFCHDTRSTAAENDDHERVPIVQREQQQQHAIQPLQSST
ncbi:hypothetical protein PSHT_15329, partial [Puccinia striiformis]